MNIILNNDYPQSLRILVYKNHRKWFSMNAGKYFLYYDLASLTKIMVTVPLIMRLFEEKKMRLDDPVGKYLGFLKPPVAHLQIQSLLRHDSGLTWWKPFYQQLLRVSPPDRDACLKKIFQKERVQKRGRCVYSDLDFILLGWIVESILDLPLDEAGRLYILEPLGLSAFFVDQNSQNRIKKSAFAPTEKTKLRGTIQGSVHDENAWAMGGVAGHAGLFGTIEAVARFGDELLKMSEGKASPLGQAKTLKKFVRRAVSPMKGDWGLGFALPSRPISSAGKNVSAQAFGHTGFTGTSLWVDAKRKAVVAILSNRTFPTRTDERFLQLRRDIHDAIWKELDKR